MIEEIIKTELTKFDVVVPAVNELSKEFLPLKIISIEDKKGYSEVSKALRFVVSKRTAVEEKRKELKADSLAFGKAVDARAKEITAMLQPIEEHLKSQKQWFDDEVERIKAIEQERKNKMIDERLDMLYGLNMYQTTTELIWKSKISDDVVSTLRVNLELWSNEDFEKFRIELKNKVNAEKEFIEEKERILKEERERIEAEKRKVEEEKKAFEKEIAEMRNQRASLRYKSLSDLGLGTMSFSPYWCYVFKYITPAIVNFIHNDDVMLLDAPQWNELFESTKQKLEELKISEDKAAANHKEQEETKKINLLNQQAILLEQQEKQKKEAAEAAEAEKIANMADKDLYLLYINKLKEVTLPNLKTKKWQGILNTVLKSIETFKNF